ncbi:hypothetical protein MO973_16945 [Paenibacillus sp. TRM 82003]|uniref:hypothetical protein n=1 Tax=Kineococcus sp. TRM81007 TaxID=2925831 RepID=UPI001F56D2F9|nr:hypothetical protein [Kineococcus sp. TRM81007]MCI2236928.1 hypothetical protein [Kineococcus sp. TRM81007]MCI3921920.1 hypothetical protein [Paenibacillus sp. TRM 82003]
MDLALPADPARHVDRPRPVDGVDHEHLARLVRGSRAQADALLAAPAATVPAALPHRETMRRVRTLVLADATSGEGGPAASAAQALAGALLDHLDALQGPTGLFDGTNLVSPPDSAFTLNDVCLVLEVVDRTGTGDRWGWARQRLLTIAERAADGLRTGGVHTPNHRWELASALAGLHHVLGDERLAARVDEWLAEGVDVDADGFYSERSAIYASVVTNPSLLTIARLLDRPHLLEPVRAHLRTLPALVDDDGEVVTVHSRRQDQREVFHVESYLSQLRRFAVTDGDGRLARLALLAAAGELPDPARHLAEAVVDPVVAQRLPPAVDAPDGTTAWPTVGLVRHRAGAVVSTVFAGADTRDVGRVASGLSNSATVLQVRAGGARLRALRISPSFFDTGALRPRVERTGPGHLVLREDRASGYYQPLPAEHRRPGGDYPLTDEGRFFARMGFGARPFDPVELSVRLDVDLDDDGARVQLVADGPRTRVAVELVLGDGQLTGTEAHPDEPGTRWLRGSTATLHHGDEALELHVEGHDDHVPPRFEDGEFFTYVHGEDRVPGQRVLLSAWSDSVVRIRVRALAP